MPPTQSSTTIVPENIAKTIGEFLSTGIGVFIFAVFVALVIAWIFLPFYVASINGNLKSILRELRMQNENAARARPRE